MKLGKIFLLALFGLLVSFNAFASNFEVVCGLSPADLNRAVRMAVGSTIIEGSKLREIQNVSSPAMDASGARICVTVTYGEDSTNFENNYSNDALEEFRKKNK